MCIQYFTTYNPLKANDVHIYVNSGPLNDEFIKIGLLPRKNALLSLMSHEISEKTTKKFSRIHLS